MAAGSPCPICRRGQMRATNLPGRCRCDACLRRFEIVSVCPSCGEHATLATSMAGQLPTCGHCTGSLVRLV